VRAYRDAFGIDLQQLVHVDMLASFKSYPHEWGLRVPDASIDHRRVLNLKVFFKRKGRELAVGRSALDCRSCLADCRTSLSSVTREARTERVLSSSTISVKAQRLRTRCSITPSPATIASVPSQLRKADFA
jgi:hypothetical protein